MGKIYDVVIVGCGPGGMSAALYASRANLNTLILEKGAPGGQLLNTDTIENYVGAKSINSMELSMEMYDNALAFGAEYMYGEVVSVERKNDLIEIKTKEETYTSKTAIIATGTIHRKLGVPGESEFDGKGVSYCATCDGAFFEDKEIAVVGGGDTALESASYLTQYGNVTLIHRRDEYRGEPHLQEIVKNNPKIKQFLNTEVVEVVSEDNKSVTQIMVRDNKQETYGILDIQGVFMNVGQLPQTQFLDEKYLTEDRWIKTNNQYETETEGIYAIGDVLDKSVRQVANAVGEGSEVAHYVFNYIQTL